ncbi:MAG TPA: helix-turn-helix domain-containing protein [Acidimicrobiales bacterium]|nr:helix-turn-helix domain-containing protein [Acidimicrobiales bacterium]
MQTGRRPLEELGLSAYEARALLALLRGGPTNSAQLARLADVPRTSTYAAIESLARLGVVRRVPGEGPAVWTALPADEVLERLQTANRVAQEEELNLFRTQLADARRVLAETFPDIPSITLPYVHLVRGAARATRALEQLVAVAKDEVLILDRGQGRIDVPGVLRDALARGVDVRVLTSDGAWPGHGAGAEVRRTATLPVAMTVADGTTALVDLQGPAHAALGGPAAQISLLVENEEMAGALALAFERLWHSL